MCKDAFQQHFSKEKYKIISKIQYTQQNLMDEKEHDFLDNSTGQKPDLLVQLFWVHLSSGVFIMRMMWSREVDELIEKCLIFVHCHRSEVKME